MFHSQTNHENPKFLKFRHSFLEWASFLVLFFGVWTIISWVANNSLICPSPLQVFGQMILQIKDPRFLITISMTILRAMEALLISFVMGLIAAFLGAFCKPVGSMLNRFVSLLQTVPNVCYIILLLFWMSREQTVIMTGFLLLFPIIYRNFYEQLLSLEKRYEPVWKVYPQPAWVRMFVICLPMLKSVCLSSLKSAASLSFKVCVTSEILTGLMPGIGKSLQIARLDLNLAGVAGWSIWLILIVFCFEKIWMVLLDLIFRG